MFPLSYDVAAAQIERDFLNESFKESNLMCIDVLYESAAVRRFVCRFPALINLQDKESIVEFGGRYYCDLVTLIKQKNK